MPIEIKELIVRAIVDGGPGNGEMPAASKSNSGSSIQEERIVARCMEQLIEYLKIQNER